MRKISLIFLLPLYLVINTAFAEHTLANFERQVAQLKGKVVLIDFWASWCIPCKDSFPWLNNIQSKYKAKNFTVLSVNLDADKSNATAFLKLLPATFPVFYDPKGKVAKAFKLKGMPSSILLDRDGKIVSRHVGFNDIKKQQYEKEIITLLQQAR
ncbi:TlpA family protein disulfide reductase [Thalassotalea sediminis]|uniref:TlpA family protein disulfide reductase n=1 Tax=Thalassotalea sediminis TaxID=1759089 RepID=UPI002573D0A7|nr:TlpA disulfide reductase family protein [Thalassotalea sediminis]